MSDNVDFNFLEYELSLFNTRWISKFFFKSKISRTEENELKNCGELLLQYISGKKHTELKIYISKHKS